MKVSLDKRPNPVPPINEHKGKVGSFVVTIIIQTHISI